MMGVHGNGLTSLVWMNPIQRSTVMELFFPEGFAHDYEYMTRGLGMTHFGFWNSRYVRSFIPSVHFFTYPHLQSFHCPTFSTHKISQRLPGKCNSDRWSGCCTIMFGPTYASDWNRWLTWTNIYTITSLLFNALWSSRQFMDSIPPEIWLRVAKFVPKEDLHDLLGGQ